MVKRERVLTHTDQDKKKTTFGVGNGVEWFILLIFTAAVAWAVDAVTVAWIHRHAIPYRYLGLLWLVFGSMLWGMTKEAHAPPKKYRFKISTCVTAGCTPVAWAKLP